MTGGELASAALFLGLVVVALVIEGCARSGLGPAPLTRTLGAAMRTTPGRAVVLLAWLWVGVHFLAR